MDVSIHFLYSKEGVTQGNPLDVIAYGICILTLISELCAAHHHFMRPWYTDDVDTGWKFAALQGHIRDMMVGGPPQGYFPCPIKRILIISHLNVLREEEYFSGMGVRVVTGSYYLGCFIGESALEKTFNDKKVKGWTDLVEVLERVVRRHPQTAYDSL